MKNNLIIASPNRDRVNSWMLSLNDYAKNPIIADRLDILLDQVEQIETGVVLLDSDLQEMNSLDSREILKRLCSKSKVIILNRDVSEEREWELLKAGVRGCCRHEISPDLLRKVVLAVQKGELWIRRTISSRIVDELYKVTSKNNTYQSSHDLPKQLTKREYEIAIHVGNGKSNKYIAQSCAISERTVKAHLSEVYQKLGVADRLKLALIMSANSNFSVCL